MSAWLHGAVGADDVLDALVPWAELHEVVATDERTAIQLDLPAPTERPSSPAMLLATVRRAGASTARLILPVPGDVRGLGTSREPGDFSAEAIENGQAVLLHGADIGVVPVGVAEGVLRWTVYRIGTTPGAEYLGLAAAEQSLRAAVRDAAATLSALDIARHRPEVRGQIADTLAARPRPPWPCGTPGRVLRVLEYADEVTAILTAAARDDDSAAVTASEFRAKADALRPLAAAVRSARLAAVAEAVRALTDDRAGRH